MLSVGEMDESIAKSVGENQSQLMTTFISCPEWLSRLDFIKNTLKNKTHGFPK